MTLELNNDDHLSINENELLPLEAEKQCPYCNKKFISKQDLEIHQIKHHFILQYKCSKCKKAFVRKDYLSGHMLTHKKNAIEKTFKCQNEKCIKKNLGFPTKAALNKHMKRHQEKTIECFDCDKLFKTEPELKAHFLSRHSNEKPYKCRTNNCEKSFSSPGSRIWHENNFDHNQ
jgi:KRAB domain-containing zinc finger protein